MLSALQETDNREVSVVARVANTLNVAQDAFFRRAIFTASVEQQLRRVGIDLYDDVLAKDKLIPTPILSKAVDDALKGTFSYMPKPSRADQRTFEKMSEGGANWLVRGIENTPFMSLAIPFPRFMANAMAFQYRYSPMGGAAGGAEMLKGYRLIQDGQTEKGMKILRDGQTKVAQGLVGTAALAAAYDYRMSNPDTEWYNVKNANGTTTDVRYIFPLAPYFAVADVFARHKQGLPAKTAEAVEAVVGMKVAAGSTATFIDQMAAAVDSERDIDKLAVTAGKLVGDFAGRFTQPFVTKQIYDYMDLLRDEGTIARDPNVVEGDTALEQFMSAASQRVESRVPIAKESLPEAIPRLREGPVAKEGEFFNRIFGFRQEAIKTPAEREVVKLGIDPYRVYGSPSGDRQYDRAFIENANKLVIPRVENVISNPEYQKLDSARKNLALTNAIREMASVAREMTKGEMMAKDIGRIYKMRFNKLPEIQRKIINDEYAKDNNGVTLEEAKAYDRLDEYEGRLQALRFAAGGFVRSAAKNIAGEATEGAVKAGKKTVADIIKERNAIKQTDELLTPQSPVVPATKPTPQQIEQAVPVAAKSPYDFPNKAFTDDEYAAAEKTMEQELGQMAKNMKVTQPKEYANMLHSYVAMEKKIKYKDMPPSPYKTDEVIDEAPVQEATAPVGKQLPFEDEPVPVFLSEKAKKGWLGDVRGFQNRDDILAQIKEVRREDFPSLRKSKLLKGIDDLAIGSTQGDFRFVNGREVNVKSAKDMAEFADMAKAAQRRLDALRKEHKNKPPKVLFHGSKSISGAEGLRSKGFADPRSLNKTEPGQVELDVNIPSFTSDLNLPFKSGSFGGRDKERFVAYEVPYAEYVFNRVNMAESDYNNKNLNVIARAISGAPNQIRPLGLPRTGYFETEDSIVDVEKLTRSSGRLSLPDDIIESKAARFEQINARRQELAANLNASASNFDDSLKSANEVYKNLRDYTKHLYRNVEMTSVKSGTGQQFEVQFTNMPVNSSSLRKVANVLRKNGSEERAALVEKIASLKTKMLNDVSAKEAQQMRKEIADTIPKLNKGGFVTRR